MITVQHNLLAGNANRQLKTTTKKRAKNMEKLSSGYRINRAADDAAGLSISEKMRRQIRGLHQAADNISEGIGYVQTADGALNEVQDMLHRMNELAVKAANGTNTETDRAYIDQEVQQLKKEMDRIFSTTTFNDKLIWEPTTEKVLAYEKKQALEFRSNSKSIDVTNDNCGVVSCSNYRIHADDTGVNVSWIGYDGQSYETDKVDWTTLEENDYSFEMSDYFGVNDGTNKLYDSNGQPVFKHKIAFTPQSSATVDDMITCIDGRTFSAGSSQSLSGRFETASGATASNKFSVYSSNINYSAAYVSHRDGTTDAHNFDAADDNYLKPSSSAGSYSQVTNTTGNLTKSPQVSSVADAKASNEGWTFSYYMDGVGMVQAKSTSAYYYASSETADDDENVWWEWRKYSNNRYYKEAIERSIGGNISGIMSALSGPKDTTGKPGLLTASESGGTVRLRFTLTADQSFSYGNGSTSTSVGSFCLSFKVNSNDTEQSVLDRIQDSLKSTTIFDLYSSSKNSDSASFWTATAARHEVDVPIYGGTCGFYVQAGTESGQHIEVIYDALSLLELDMVDTNVLTIEDAGSTIDTVKQALQKISGQRSDFGAYQNRLEHAYNNNKNVEENTQASESVIRDTDIAKAMIEYSSMNILQQAGTSMLSQANQANQLALSLLE